MARTKRGHSGGRGGRGACGGKRKYDGRGPRYSSPEQARKKKK
jgi:hypothetical protein